MQPSPTEKQLKAIQTVESVLGITFTGSSKNEARLWLMEHMPKSMEKANTNNQNQDVTDKQGVAIRNVEGILGAKFQGATKADARLWLMEHMPKAVDLVTQKLVEAERQQSEKRSGKETTVHRYPHTADAMKLEYMETIESFPDVPDMESLKQQITMLKLGLQLF